MRTIILTACLLIPYWATSQKIAVNETDEFTGNRVIKTEWEKLSAYLDFTVTYSRISKINGDYFLEIKHMNDKINTIPKEEIMYLKLKNGEIIELLNLETTVSSHGGGSIGFAGSKALGFHLIFHLPEMTYYKLRESLLEKIRINTSEGYIEVEVVEKKAKVFLNCLKLFSAN